GQADELVAALAGLDLRHRQPLRPGLDAHHPLNKEDVIPAKAGTHSSTNSQSDRWIPAFAGMTNLFSVQPNQPAFPYPAWQSLPQRGGRLFQPADGVGIDEGRDHLAYPCMVGVEPGDLVVFE